MKLNLFYLHSWLMSHRLAAIDRNNFGLGASKQNEDLFLTLDLIIQKDNAFLYSNDFDEYVYHELIRAKRSVFRSLTDYFVFENSLNREIDDIIYLDILNQKVFDTNLKLKEGEEDLRDEVAQIDKLRTYIKMRIEQL